MTDLVTLQNTLTMSSLEIAELTGKQHKNVLADIRNMLHELKIDWAEFSAEYIRKLLGELDLLAADFSAVRFVRGKELLITGLLRALIISSSPFPLLSK